MEAQELEINSQTDVSNIIDLTNTKISEITETIKKKRKNGKFRPKTPKPRLKLYGQRPPDARMRQHISEIKLRLYKFNKDSKKGKK